MGPHCSCASLVGIIGQRRWVLSQLIGRRQLIGQRHPCVQISESRLSSATSGKARADFKTGPAAAQTWRHERRPLAHSDCRAAAKSRSTLVFSPAAPGRFLGRRTDLQRVARGQQQR
jgi:hypothetical protein